MASRWAKFLCVVFPHGSDFAVPEDSHVAVFNSGHEFPYHFFDWTFAADCAWTFFVMNETYVDVTALRMRLECLWHEVPRVFGRLADRHDNKYPMVRGQPLTVPKLTGGLLVSRGAARNFTESVSRSCHPVVYEALLQRSQREVQTAARSDVGPAFTAGDFSAAICLAFAGVPPLRPFAHHGEHYVLGALAAERVSLRRAFEFDAQLVGMRACVLVAHPVGLRQAQLLGGNRGTCSAAFTAHFASVAGVSLQVDEEALGYYADIISQKIDSCGWIAPPRSESPALPPAPDISGVRKLMLVGMPGGATSWFFDALQLSARSGDAVHSGYFHPYCNELWRFELSHFTGAPEDQTFVHMFRQAVPEAHFDHLVSMMVSHAMKGKVSGMFLTRENINVLRVPDFARQGFHLVALYRHRKHTFPVSDPGGSPESYDDGAVFLSTLCRSCFYLQMYHAIVTQQDLEDEVLKTLQQFLLYVDDRGARLVLVHTVFWYAVLRQQRLGGYHLPILEYGRIMTGSREEAQGYVLNALPRWPGFEESVFALLSTRKSVTWMEQREEKYLAQLGTAEAVVQEALLVIRRLDPHTDISLLEM